MDLFILDGEGPCSLLDLTDLLPTSPHNSSRPAKHRLLWWNRSVSFWPVNASAENHEVWTSLIAGWLSVKKGVIARDYSACMAHGKNARVVLFICLLSDEQCLPETWKTPLLQRTWSDFVLEDGRSYKPCIYFIPLAATPSAACSALYLGHLS